MPFIFIGTGGMGKETVSRIKYMTEKARMGNTFFLGFDIDRTYSTEATGDIPLPNISVDRPASNIEAQEKADNKEFFKWWPEKYYITSALSGSTGAGQIRINGRFALFMKYDVVRTAIKDVLDRARDLAKKDPNDGEIFVFLISSLGGGTGAGIFMDISFIVRSMLGESDRLYGVFFDGTITKGYQTNTLHFSYAALQEIEYWLQNFSRFEMQYAGGQKLSGKSFKKLFDLIFLVQAETMDGKKFKTEEKSVSPYIPMVAEAMFSMLSLPDVRKYFIANQWNRFDNMSSKGMQIRYAGFAVGSINYDEEGVLDYAANQMIKRFILSQDPASSSPGKSVEITGSPFDEVIEKALQIGERVDQSLTGRILHTSANYGSIMNRLTGFKKKLYPLTKLDEIQQLKSQYKIPLKATDAVDEWGDFFAKYQEDVKIALFEARTRFKEKLEDYMTRFVKASAMNYVPLNDWLNSGIGVIEKNIDYVQKYKKSGMRNEEIEAINKSWGVLGKDKKLLFGRVKAENKTKLTGAVETWIKDEIVSIEAGLLRDFYENLKAILLEWSSTIAILQDKISDVRQRIGVQIGKYTSRDVAYNIDSLASNEFPLHIKLDINKDLIDEFVIENRILSNPGIKEEISSLADTICSGKGEMKGILDYFRIISREVLEKREKDIRGESKIADDILNLIKTIVKEKIRSYINSVRIDDVLEHWLKEQVYPVAKKYHDDNNRRGLLELKERWTINFGEDQADKLLAQDYYTGTKDSRNKWFDVALRSFIFNFRNKINPFVRYGTALKLNYWDKINLDTNVRNACQDRVTVFLPDKFRFAGAVAKGVDANIQYSKEGHNSIKIFAETYAFPLHSLDLVKGYQEANVRDEYLEHRKEVCGQIAAGEITDTLRHIDKRFYSDWYVDIADDEVSDAAGYWLYIFALGLGFISRDAKKKFILAMGGKKKTIDGSLPGTLEKLKKADLRQSLRSGISDAVKSKYYGEGQDYAKILELFQVAAESHKKSCPPRTPATENAYKLWFEINEYIKILSGGTFSPSAKIPKDWAACEKLLNSL